MFILYHNFVLNILIYMFLGLYDEPVNPKVVFHFPALYLTG